MKQTHHLHNDNKPTIVEINGKYYDLIPNEWTTDMLIATPPLECPHVRRLSLIPERTEQEQIVHNKEQDQIHTLLNKSRKRAPLGTTMRRAIADGIGIPDKVRELLAMKAKATDRRELRRIRKALRKLDYKRYQ